MNLREPTARLELQHDAAIGAELTNSGVAIVVDPHAAQDEVVNGRPNAVKIIPLARRLERDKGLASGVDLQAKHK